MENNLRTVKSFRIFIAKGMVSDYWIVLAFSDIKLFQDSKSFSSIYKKKDDECLLDSKFIWDIICSQKSKSFQGI